MIAAEVFGAPVWRRKRMGAQASAHLNDARAAAGRLDVVVVNNGMGNLRSVVHALEYLGCPRHRPRQLHSVGLQTPARGHARALTFDTYNDVDCQHYRGLHDWIKFLKYGYGRATDHASREIRLKRMSREEGIAMVRRYQDVVPHDKKRYVDWVGMDEIEFDACIDARRDPRIWERIDGGWQLRDGVANHASGPEIENARLERRETCEFGLAPSKDLLVDEDRYVLMARGYSPANPAVNRRSQSGQSSGKA